MIQDIEKQFFADKQVANAIYDLEYFFTELEDVGQVISLDCRYAKPSGVSLVRNCAIQPSSSHGYFQELHGNTVSASQFNRLNEQENRDYAMVVVVTIKQIVDAYFSLEKLCWKMLKRNCLAKVLYKSEEQVFFEGLVIKSHTKLMVMKNLW